ncbi:hypothetical protein Ddc_02179 [Ditylenchus destructor]|nr:hypothetical protein Ddc_02179 [Ditylenchus destructor]
MLPILRMAATVFLNLTFSALDSFDATLNPFLDGRRRSNVFAERVETLDSLPFERGFSKKAFGTLLCGTLAVVDSLPAPLHNQSSVSAVPEKTAQLNISPAYYICLASAALCFNFFPGFRHCASNDGQQPSPWLVMWGFVSSPAAQDYFLALLLTRHPSAASVSPSSPIQGLPALVCAL